jgi:prolyl-tRNA editing enzyme YbaK/EbsC (Cys-tRNA(Pro) deacylase)
MQRVEENMKVLEEIYDYSSGYENIVPHRAAYSAQEIQEIAESLKFQGKALARVVFLKDVDHFILAVLPAERQIDLEKFKEILRSNDLRIVPEDELIEVFPESQGETTSCLSDLFNVGVYVDDCLTGNEAIVHFAALTWPKVYEFCLRD